MVTPSPVAPVEVQVSRARVNTSVPLLSMVLGTTRLMAVTAGSAARARICSASPVTTTPDTTLVVTSSLAGVASATVPASAGTTSSAICSTSAAAATTSAASPPAAAVCTPDGASSSTNAVTVPSVSYTHLRAHETRHD